MNRSPRRLKKCGTWSRRYPVEPIAQEALPLGFLRLGFDCAYGSYAGGFGTQYAVTSYNADSERADGENNQHTTP
jgi:hypothetical protein